MSATIKAAITALKGRIAAAYSAISAKGGTLPATQDSDNLASAIATIPSATPVTSTYLANSNMPNSFDILDLSHLQISDSITTLNHMFNGCNRLTSLVDISGWNVSNITRLTSLFNNCTNLETIGDISNWDTHNVTDLSYMFGSCAKLNFPESLNWNTSQVTTMQRLFYLCYKFNIRDLSGWNVENVTNLSEMFYTCTGLEEINLSGWDMRKTTTLYATFYNCNNLTSINFSQSQTSNLLTSLNQTFYNCTKVVSITGLSNWDTSSVIDMGWLFRNNYKLTSLDLTGWSLASVTTNPLMFGSCSMLTSLRVGSGWVKGCDLSTTGLTHDGIVQFFNDLPTISTSQTITLGSTKLGYLSAAEKAIATDKGWTLA